MKLRLAYVIVILSVLVFALAGSAYAQWSALSSGYAVTTDWHGQYVPLGSVVTVWAGTTHGEVNWVEFQWKYPDKTVAWINLTDVFGPYVTPAVPLGVHQEIIDWAAENQGVHVWYACVQGTPDVLGDWGVQARFHSNPSVVSEDTTIVAIRATSMNTVPEVPFGTIVMSLSMLAVLGGFTLRRKRYL